MKLLLCRSCGDIFNLTQHIKECSCRNAGGRYVGGSHPANAEYWGDEKVVPFAIDNFSFLARMRSDLYKESNVTDDIYDHMHGKNKIQTWILAEGNPNFKTMKKVPRPYVLDNT